MLLSCQEFKQLFDRSHYVETFKGNEENNKTIRTFSRSRCSLWDFKVALLRIWDDDSMVELEFKISQTRSIRKQNGGKAKKQFIEYEQWRKIIHKRKK